MTNIAAYDACTTNTYVEYVSKNIYKSNQVEIWRFDGAIDHKLKMAICGNSHHSYLYCGCICDYPLLRSFF